MDHLGTWRGGVRRDDVGEAVKPTHSPDAWKKELGEEFLRVAMMRAASRSLYDFVPRVSPQFTAPRHLAGLVDALDCAMVSEVKVCSSTPPRHTKTSTIVHWIIRRILTVPDSLIAYITYNQTRGESVSRTARAIAERAGVKFTTDSLGEWRTSNGCKVIWTGVGGSLTGEGFHVVIVDDPIKDREEAESQLQRQKVYDWFNGVVYTRQEPGKRGTSFVVNHTRWHPDDLIGRLTAQGGWEVVNLPAINDAGEALWPEFFSLERLRETEAQIGPYEFSALYQGKPRQKGATVFGDAHYFEAMPTGYSVSAGVDIAYTVRTWSDFSVVVVLYVVGGVAYVVDVLRVRAETPVFKCEAVKMLAPHGVNRDARNPGVNAYIGGTEKGVLDLFKAQDGTPPLYMNAINAAGEGDKFARSQPVAAAWNAGRVQVPKSIAALGNVGRQFTDRGKKPTDDVPWLQPFLDEVCNFTGISDPHDDQVDALAGAYRPFTVGHASRDIRNLPPG